MRCRTWLIYLRIRLVKRDVSAMLDDAVGRMREDEVLPSAV